MPAVINLPPHSSVDDTPSHDGHDMREREAGVDDEDTFGSFCCSAASIGSPGNECGSCHIAQVDQ